MTRDKDRHEAHEQRPLRLWRYRYQLAPIYAVTALALVALVGHYAASNQAAIFGSAAIGAAAIYVGWKLSSTERAVIGGIGTYFTGWLTWMIYRGSPPWDGLIPWGLAAAVIPAALWWDHYRVRNQIAAQRKVDSWGPLARAIGIGGTRIRHVVVNKWWWSAELRHTGHRFDEVKGAEELLEQHLHRDENAVTIERTGKAGVAKITVVEKDPHAEPILITDLPEPSRKPTDPIVIGPHVDGEFGAVRLATERGERHVLTAGSTDGGKTSLTNVLVRGTVLQDDTVNVFADFKHGQAARPWAPAMGLVITDTADFREFMKDLLREAEWRGTVVKGNSWVPRRDGAPRLRLWVDEFAEVAGDYRVIEMLESGFRRFRSLGIGISLATQVSTNAGVGSSVIKGQCSIRACARMEERAHAKHVLRNHGDVDATAIPQDRPGSLFIEAEGVRKGSLIRAGWLPREWIEQFAIQHAPHQPALSSFIGQAVDLGMITPQSQKETIVVTRSRFQELEDQMNAEAAGMQPMPAVSIQSTIGGDIEEIGEPGDDAVEAHILAIAANAGARGFQISDVPTGPGMSRSSIGRAFPRMVRQSKLRVEGRARSTRYYTVSEMASAR